MPAPIPVCNHFDKGASPLRAEVGGGEGRGERALGELLLDNLLYACYPATVMANLETGNHTHTHTHTHTHVSVLLTHSDHERLGIEWLKAGIPEACDLGFNSSPSLAGSVASHW